MNKKLLLEKYIKVAVRKALKEQEEQQRRAEKAMYLVYRFPNLKRLLEDLMSPSFGRFVSGVDIVSPKPTVFKVGLINGQDFTITYLGSNNFSIKVSGKKYFDKSLAEIERASNAISQLLEFSYALKEEEMATEPSTTKDQELAQDLNVGGTTGGTETGELTAPTPEAPPTEETPA
jgi:hypothetical protein